MTIRRLLAMLLIVTTLLLLLRPVKVLTFKDEANRMLFDIIEIERDQLIEYTFIHSVSKTPVIEGLWVNDNDDFVTTTVKYQDQSGAGLPEQAFAAEDFEQRDGWFVMKGLSVSSPSITMHVNINYQNTLRINQKEIRLYRFFEEDKGILTLSSSSTPFIVYFLEKAFFVKGAILH